MCVRVHLFVFAFAKRSNKRVLNGGEYDIGWDLLL